MFLLYITQVFGAAFTIVMCLEVLNLSKRQVNKALMQQIKDEIGYIPLQFNRTSISKYLAKTENTFWSKHILKQHKSLKYNSGPTLTGGALEKKAITKCNNQKFLVYRCDSSSWCGGWGDRQKGIVSTFLLSLLTERLFIIDIDNPCKLENILVPNIYNWSTCLAFVKSAPSQNVIHANYIDNKAKLEEIRNFDFNRKWPSHIVVSRFNNYAISEIRQHKLAKTRLKWLLNITNEEAMHLVLNTLFKPTHGMLKDAISFYDNQVKGRLLVCGHIRVGKNPSIPSDINLRFGVPNITMLLDFLKLFDVDGTNAIYIASDSENVKKIARTRIRSYINMNRTIVHVDRLEKSKKIKSEACDGWKTVVLEQFILSQCDILVLTRSGLGTIAAYMRGDYKNLFMFHPVIRTIVETKWIDLQRAFNFL